MQTVEPADDAKVPAAQLTHELPGAQESHVDAPEDAWNVPAAQLAHELWPLDA